MMPRTKLRLGASIAFALTLGLLAACSAQRLWIPWRHTSTTLGWFPLDGGTEWVYQFKNLAARGQGDYQFRLVSRGQVDVAVLHRKVFVVDELSPQGRHPTAYYWENGYLTKVLGLGYDPNGDINWEGKQVLAEFGFEAGGNTQKVMPLETRIGASWSEDTQILNSAVKVRNRIASKESVDTPAGHFDNVLRLDSSMSVKPARRKQAPGEKSDPVPDSMGDEASYSYSDWYAQGVGLVRSRVTLEDGSPAAEILLLDVHSAASAGDQHAAAVTDHNG